MTNIYVKKQSKTPRPNIKPAGIKPYNYSGRVINGDLCKECCNDKNCKDKKCPLYKWRK